MSPPHWEQVTLRERLSHQALHDPLTGLPNRALLLDRLAQALSRRPSNAAQRRVAVALIDLDEFKAVNDGLGHAAGDFVLEDGRAIGSRGPVRPADTLARFGGDEFALLCDSVPDEQVAIAIVNRLLGGLGAPLAVEGAVLTVIASAGVALTVREHAPATTAESLLREADTALYRAKHHGGARAELFDEGMQIQAQARLTLEAELGRAIDQDELVIHYQPIRSAVDHHVMAVEALVRWQSPARGMLAPDVFLPLAEQTGLIVPLGQWVLRTACQQAADMATGKAGRARRAPSHRDQRFPPSTRGPRIATSGRGDHQGQSADTGHAQHRTHRDRPVQRERRRARRLDQVWSPQAPP